MAAEAVLELAIGEGNSGPLKTELIAGNNCASKFTDVLASDFASKYTVVAHQANTVTRFRGPLFKDNQTGELTISFRSTEFLDDNARDNMATNTLELKEFGWAFGQIADMEKWYAELRTT